MFRRSILGIAAASLVSSVLLASPARATEAPSGWPESPDAWPTCASDSAQFCVESATVTPVGGVSTPLAQYGVGVTVTSTTQPGVYWQVDGLDSAAPAVRDGELRLVMRGGTMFRGTTEAVGRDVRIDGNNAGSSRLTVTGHAIHQDRGACDNLTCGDADTMASAEARKYAFEGRTIGYNGEYPEVFAGIVMTSDAQVFRNWYYTDNGVDVALANLRLDAAGNATRGSFSALLPVSFFVGRSRSVEQALKDGYEAIVNPVSNPVVVPVTATLRDGGILLDVPDFGYTGVTAVSIVNRKSTATPGAAVPGRPQAVKVSKETGGLRVSWSAPASDGGLPVTTYTARAFTAATGGSVAGRCVSDGTSCVISGLTGTYFVAVSATNGLGEGPGTSTRVPSAASGAVPSVPRSVVVTPGNGALTVAWAAPLSPGGSPITGYTARVFNSATANSSQADCEVTTRTCTINGLANGRRYWVSVLAKNAIGSGPQTSPRVAATPRTVAGAPRTVTATSSGRKVRVGWHKPISDGGAAVTGYTAKLYTSATAGTVAAQCTGGAAALSCTTGDLAVGKTYYAAVTATNVAGASPASGRVRVVVRR